MPTDRELWLNKELSAVQEQLDAAKVQVANMLGNARLQARDNDEALKERDAARAQRDALVEAGKKAIQIKTHWMGEEVARMELEAAIAAVRDDE